MGMGDKYVSGATLARNRLRYAAKKRAHKELLAAARDLVLQLDHQGAIHRNAPSVARLRAALGLEVA
jgi:hypothetical protein